MRKFLEERLYREKKMIKEEEKIFPQNNCLSPYTGWTRWGGDNTSKSELLSQLNNCFQGIYTQSFS